jgi:hypothetical protein
VNPLHLSPRFPRSPRRNQSPPASFLSRDALPGAQRKSTKSLKTLKTAMGAYSKNAASAPLRRPLRIRQAPLRRHLQVRLAAASSRDGGEGFIEDIECGVELIEGDGQRRTERDDIAAAELEAEAAL